MGLITRDAGPADAAAVSRLLDALGYPATEAEARAHVERFAADPATRLQVVAEAGGEPIGLVATHPFYEAMGYERVAIGYLRRLD